MRLLNNENYICRVLEEIIIYDEPRRSIKAVLTVLEKAQIDLDKLTKHWNSPDPENMFMRLDEFSEEKLIFICLQTMAIIEYLHS